MRLLRLAFALGVAMFFWGVVGGLVYVVASQGGLPLRTDPLSDARRRALRGDVAGAMRQYRVATLIEPTDLNARAELGELLARAGRYDEALAAYEAALHVRLDPRVLAGMGDVLAAKGEYVRAALAYQESLRLRPNQPDLYQRLGRALRAASQQ